MKRFIKANDLRWKNRINTVRCPIYWSQSSKLQRSSRKTKTPKLKASVRKTKRTNLWFFSRKFVLTRKEQQQTFEVRFCSTEEFKKFFLNLKLEISSVVTSFSASEQSISSMKSSKGHFCTFLRARPDTKSIIPEQDENPEKNQPKLVTRRVLEPQNEQISSTSNIADENGHNSTRNSETNKTRSPVVKSPSQISLPTPASPFSSISNFFRVISALNRIRKSFARLFISVRKRNSGKNS